MKTLREHFNDALINAMVAKDADTKFALANRAWAMNDPIGIDLDDVCANNKLILSIFEDLAKGGHAGAMHACAMIYASGEADQSYSVEEKPWDNEIHSAHNKPGLVVTASYRPDWQKALTWCKQAADAGHKGAADVLPRMTQAAANAPKA